MATGGISSNPDVTVIDHERDFGLGGGLPLTNIDSMLPVDGDGTSARDGGGGRIGDTVDVGLGHHGVRPLQGRRRGTGHGGHWYPIIG